LFEKLKGVSMEPKFNFADSEAIPWLKSEIAEGVEVKTLCSANNMIMELYRFAPNITYPDHVHEGPEFVYLLEGSARQDGKWLEAGCASSAETGTLDSRFLSGEKGCLTVAVYTRSRYI
jgi:anti-sigma factor ChrR (cupin superfamily)